MDKNKAQTSWCYDYDIYIIYIIYEKSSITYNCPNRNFPHIILSIHLYTVYRSSAIRSDCTQLSAMPGVLNLARHRIHRPWTVCEPHVGYGCSMRPESELVARLRPPTFAVHVARLLGCEVVCAAIACRCCCQRCCYHCNIAFTQRESRKCIKQRITKQWRHIFYSCVPSMLIASFQR